MSTVTCPRCGASNVANARYCITCGTPLATPPAMPQQVAPPPPPQPTPQQYYSYTASYWEVQRSGKINNTKTGLLLLMIGSLISWVPFVNFVGGIVILIGAILVIVGREAFGHEHDRNVIIAIIIFVVGIGVAIVAFFVALLTAISTAGTGFTTGQPTIFSLVGLVAGAVFGIAEVIFTYALQNSNGRILLWSAYILSLVLGTVNAIIVQPLITSTGGLAIFTSGLFLLTDLLALPAAVIYGLTFYMAHQRIVHGEIPPRPTQQPSPTWSSGYMPPSQQFLRRATPYGNNSSW